MLLLAMAAVAVPGPVLVSPAAPPHADLNGAEPPGRCGTRRDGGDIVVCGRDQADERFRLRDIPDAARYDPRPLRAGTTVFGQGRLSVHTQAAEVGGVVSNRAMVTLAFPF